VTSRAPAASAALAALAALAEDPERYVEPPEGARQVVDPRFTVVVAPDGQWSGVCALRLPVDEAALAAAVADVRALTAGSDLVLWNVGSSATPAELPQRLRTYGLQDPDPPFDPVCAAMVLDSVPPAADGVEVRRIGTLEEHLAGLEVMLAAAEWAPEHAAAERARARDVFERRTRRGGFQWLALVDGEPVAFGAADRADAGLFLAGGSTLPAARGRGCYRALVHARWEEAQRLGLPGLAVQAQYDTSAPILRRLGFAEVAQVHTLRDR
jgi:GNAT superfamily N-acetyltransferase